MRSGWNRVVIPPAGRSRRGFTLIEVLVVVVIAAIAATIALPGFVRTMRGSQLRMASRTVLMAHKYARSTAVLRQVPMAILLDREHSEVEIIALTPAAGSDARGKFLDTRESRAADTVLGAEADQMATPAIQSELLRKFGRDVNIDTFRSERGGQEFQGVFWINYHPNGMSDGFELILTDKNNRSVTIVSDPISGRVDAKFGNF